MEWSEGWNVLARDFDQSFVCRFALSLGDSVPRAIVGWTVDVVGIECNSWCRCLGIRIAVGVYMNDV
jgi:hypothetical protein